MYMCFAVATVNMLQRSQQSKFFNIYIYILIPASSAHIIYQIVDKDRLYRHICFFLSKINIRPWKRLGDLDLPFKVTGVNWVVSVFISIFANTEGRLINETTLLYFINIMAITTTSIVHRSIHTFLIKQLPLDQSAVSRWKLKLGFGSLRNSYTSLYTIKFEIGLICQVNPHTCICGLTWQYIFISRQLSYEWPIVFG